MKSLWALVVLALAVDASSLAVTCRTPSVTLYMGQGTIVTCDLVWNACASNATYTLATSPVYLVNALRIGFQPGVVTAAAPTKIIYVRLEAGTPWASGVHNFTLTATSGYGCDAVAWPTLTLNILCGVGTYGCALCASYGGTCSSCQAGFYMATPDPSHGWPWPCRYCPAGTYSAQGATACQTCPLGSTSTTAASFCTKACKTYQNVATNCTSCPSGSTLLPDTSSDCPGGVATYPMSTGAYNQPPMGLDWRTANNYNGYGYFDIHGNQLLTSLPTKSMACSLGVQLSSTAAPFATMAKMSVLPGVVTYTNAITLSLWLHINSGQPQLSWNQMARTSTNQLILPPAGSVNSCLFGTTSTTCVLTNSIVVLPAIPRGQDVFFVISERLPGFQMLRTCSLWSAYYNGVAQTASSCTAQDQNPNGPGDIVIGYSSDQTTYDGVFSGLTVYNRPVTPSEVFLQSNCQATPFEPPAITTPSPPLCLQGDRVCKA